MKYIVIVPDGMADEPIEELEGKTPLEVAHTTNMDFMAQNGSIGTVQTIPEGFKPGSDIGNMALLGYNPVENFSGRAPLEAANMNIMLEKDEIAFRCNLVTIEDGKMMDYSAGHISTKEAKGLIESLDQQMDIPDIKFYPGKSYRHLLVIKTSLVQELFDLSCTPPHDILGKEIKPFLPQGAKEPLILRLMEKSKTILEGHSINNVRIDLQENPANMIWLWGQGTRPSLPAFKDKFGLDGSIISAVDLVNGLGRLAGLEVIDVPGITGYYDTNYKGKAEYALDALRDKDYVYVHIEAPDEAGHNGDIKAKINSIEKIDSEIVGTILNHFNNEDDVRVLISPDHPTPINKRTHTSDPVGFVMYGKNVPKDDAAHYAEVTARETGLFYESGEKLIESFIRKNL